MEVFDRLYAKFEADGHDLLISERNNGRLTTSGQPRINLRNLYKELFKTAEAQFVLVDQIRLLLLFAGDFYKFCEYSLAIECYEIVLQKCDEIEANSSNSNSYDNNYINNNSNSNSYGDSNSSVDVISTRYCVEATQQLVQANYHLLLQLKNVYISPMVVSQLLLCLKQLKNSIDKVYELTTRQQEEFAWQILNSCKLIYEIGQPLIWKSCGKYVAETLLYAATAMESVINLCTVRHIKFRMKLYSSVFYALLVQGVLDQATAVYEHADRQAKQLREREELDPPIPTTTILIMDQVDLDLAVMKATLDYWKLPEGLNLNDKHFASNNDKALELTKKTFTELVLLECIRVHMLSSGNKNENFRKRSTTIIKAIDTDLQSYELPKVNEEQELAEGNAEEKDTAEPIELSPTAKKYTTEVLLELLSLVLFEVTEGVNGADLAAKLIALAKEHSTGMLSDSHRRCYQDIRLLTQVNSLINRQERDVSVEAITLQEVCDELESLMNSAESSRRKSFLNKIVFNLWNKYIYPILQAALSTNDSEVALKELKLITPTLQVVVNTTHVTGLEDPVLVACLSLLTANLLLYLDDPPGCIALLKKSIETIDEQRAARVDVELNMPEDVRDIYALQRQSFTTRSEAQDWFHSVKRLGAHAFAGFGIFGLSSTADRSDQALAEIHCDMLSVYFRVELDYAIHQKILKRDLKQKTLAMEQAAKAASTTVKTLAETSTKKKPKVLGTAGLGVEPDPNSFDMEKLNIYHTLKSYACRSSYHRCIFYMELARVEKETEKKKKCLVDAFKAIEEAEGREEALKESFADLVVMKEDVWTYPVVLARTNRYIYVCPVGNRAFSNAYYYRILAKDKGSGTDVSMFNTDIAGCEKKIYVSDLHHIKSNVVRIGPLRTGEQYVFGQAAFSQTDKAFGQVSPTTIPVEAVNPLPTVMLWAILNQVALEMNYKSISKNAAFRVCSRFFLTTPSLTPATIGKGINIFLAPEPALCMLAVQQASPIILQCFLNSFMSYESLTKAVNDVEHGAVYWQMRKSKQLKVLVTVHRIAVVATIACAISNHDLVVKCVLQGHDFSMELLAYDTPHLAYTLQNPLTVFVIALQSIAKKNWRSLEHKLYCKLFSILIKLSVINRNIQPVLSLLNSIYLEVDDKEAFDLSVPPQELFVNYLALYEVACQCINPKHLTEMSRHMIAVLSNAQPDKPLEEPEEDAPGKFWQLHYIGRTLQLRDKALTIVTSGQEVLSSIQEKPKYLSQLLQVVVQLGRELANGSNYSEFHQLLEKVPLYEEYLSPAVRGVTSQWELKLLQPLSNRLVATVDAKISKKTPNKGKTPKKGEEVVPDGPDPRLLVPDRFINCSAEEETAQLSWLSELIYICANCLYPKANQKTLNCFPQSTFGPELQIDPKTFAVDFEKRTVMGGIGVIEMLQSIADEGRTLTRVNTAEKLPSTDEDTAAGTILSPRKVEILDRELTRAEYIRYIGASIEAFGRSHRSYSAVYVTSKLWDLIISEWLDPVEFAIEFKDIRSLLLQVVVVIVNSLELVAFNRDAYSELSKLGEFTMATEAKDLNTMTTIVTGISGDSTNNTREMQELLAITNNLLIYLIKVLWLYNYYKEVVSLGGRIFQLISEISKDLCKSYGNHCLPLICHAQETLTDRSKDALAQKESDLQKFVFDYEEAQKKKRKKKVRIARTEKDEEELLFDAEKEVYQRKIDAANVVLNDALILLGKVQLQQQAFDTLYSTGSQLLGKVRKLSQEFLKEISSQYGDNVNYLQLGQVEAVQDKLEMIDDQFAQVCNYLREKKERLILIEALKEQGDLLLLFGKVHEAKSIWNDAVDGLFNRIDSCTEWYSICQNVVPSFDDNLVIGIIPTIVVLG